MPLPSPRKSVQRVLTLLISSVLSLLAAEAILRAFFPIYLSDQYLRPDDELYLTPRENFRATIQKDYTFTVRFNSLGIRRDSEVSPKQEGMRRILVVGDSYTFGSGVSNGETYSDFLEKFLNDPDGSRQERATFCAAEKGEPEPTPSTKGIITPLARELFLASLENIRGAAGRFESRTGRRPRLAFAISYIPGPGMLWTPSSYDFLRDELARAAEAERDALFIDVSGAFPWKPADAPLRPGERLVDCLNRHSDGHWSPAGNAFFARRLAAHLKPHLPPGGRTEVFNAGVQGWGSLEYAIRIRKLLGDVQPDIVLVMFTTNDLRDNELFLQRPSRIHSVVLERGRRYAWQVQAVFAEGTISRWSPEAEFTVGSKDTEKAPAPATLAGKDGAPVPIGPLGSAPVSPRFSWKPVPGA